LELNQDTLVGKSLPRSLVRATRRFFARDVKVRFPPLPATRQRTVTLPLAERQRHGGVPAAISVGAAVRRWRLQHAEPAGLSLAGSSLG
jgi:hypothetical protein